MVARDPEYVTCAQERFGAGESVEGANPAARACSPEVATTPPLTGGPLLGPKRALALPDFANLH